MTKLTYENLREYLNSLAEENDPRLLDSVTIYSAHDGEYRPADIMEAIADDDEPLDDGHLFLYTVDRY